MNGNNDADDDYALCVISDSLSQVPVARPPKPEAIMAKGRARRHRRRISAMTAALAVVAAGTGAAVTLSGGSQTAGSHTADSQAGGPTVHAQLAAWSVSKRADGDLHVTVSELSDPAGLQSTLRADGVPASVTFLNQPNTTCSRYPHGTDPSLLARIFPPSGTGAAHHVAGGPNIGTGPDVGRGGQGLVIDPAAIPSAVGLQLAWNRIGDLIVGRQDLVQKSPQCTGS